MGWFKDSEGNVLGDSPLDLARRTLLEIARTYQDANGRPPTLAELQKTLAVVLGSSAGDIAQELNDLDVTGVVIKSKKRGTSKQTWATGDSFWVRLPNDTYTFGRIVVRQPPKKGEALVEFFRHCARVPAYRPAIAGSGRIFGPVNVNGIAAFETGRWRIVDHDPAFRAPDHEAIRMFSGPGDTIQLFDADYRTVVRTMPRREVPSAAFDKSEYCGYFPPDADRRLTRLEESVAAALAANGVTPDMPD